MTEKEVREQNDYLRRNMVCIVPWHIADKWKREGSDKMSEKTEELCERGRKAEVENEKLRERIAVLEEEARVHPIKKRVFGRDVPYDGVPVYWGREHFVDPETDNAPLSTSDPVGFSIGDTEQVDG